MIINQYQPFLILNDEDEYKEYYMSELCSSPIDCFDNLSVKFRPERFNHAFYERSKRYYKHKDVFSIERAKRMSWIKTCLQDDTITPLAGYDKRRKKYDHSRRVSFITPDNFVVVIRLINPEEAQFVTCFVPDNPYVTEKIRKSPLWDPQKMTIK